MCRHPAPPPPQHAGNLETKHPLIPYHHPLTHRHALFPSKSPSDSALIRAASSSVISCGLFVHSSHPPSAPDFLSMSRSKVKVLLSSCCSISQSHQTSIHPSCLDMSFGVCMQSLLRELLCQFKGNDILLNE